MIQIGVWHLHRAEIEQLMRQGVSMAEIGRRFSVSRQRICEVLKAHNLPTRAPMLNQREVTVLLVCSGEFLRGLEHKGLISPIHSGLNHGHTYYPESELKKIRAIMDEKGMAWERRKKRMVVVTQPP